MHYESYRTFFKDQAPPQRRFGRRSVLKMAAVGMPLVAGGALIARGSLLVADLRERERNVGKLAANSGRAYEAVTGADALVVVTEWNEFREPDFRKIKSLMRHAAVFDGRNVYEPRVLHELGFHYEGIGRR